MLLAYLFVARTHAVQQGDAPRSRAVGTCHTALVEHPFDVGRGENVVVEPVAVFFLDGGVEQREARREHHGVAVEPLAVGEGHAFGRETADFGTGAYLDFFLLDAAAQLREYLFRRSERGEQRVPAPELAARFGFLFENERFDAPLCKAQGRLHARGTAAYDDNLFHTSFFSFGRPPIRACRRACRAGSR